MTNRDVTAADGTELVIRNATARRQQELAATAGALAASLADRKRMRAWALERAPRVAAGTWGAARRAAAQRWPGRQKRQVAPLAVPVAMAAVPAWWQVRAGSRRRPGWAD